MEWIAQALMAAGLTASFSRFYEIRLVALAGIIGGLVPCLDWLYRVPATPAVAYALKEGITYSLCFIPLGALITATLVFGIRRVLESRQVIDWQGRHQPRTGAGRILVSRQFEQYRDTQVPPVGPPLTFPRLYFFSLLALLGPGLFRATGSSGVDWLWPFSRKPVAWNLVHAFDPLVLVFLSVGLIAALIVRDKKPARWGVMALMLYCLLAYFQRERSETALRQYAGEQNWRVESLAAYPTWANLNLKRGILQMADGSLHVCAVNLPMIGSARIYPGEKFEPFQPLQEYSLAEDSRAARQLQALERATGGYAAFVQYRGERYASDLRFSPLPYSAIPRVGFWLREPVSNQSTFPRRHFSLDTSEQRMAFFRMWMGQDLPEPED